MYKQRAQEVKRLAQSLTNSSFLCADTALRPDQSARKIVALQDWEHQQAEVESLTKQISELTEKVRLTTCNRRLWKIKQNSEAVLCESGSIASARIAPSGSSTGSATSSALNKRILRRS